MFATGLLVTDSSNDVIEKPLRSMTSRKIMQLGVVNKFLVCQLN